MKRVTVNLDDEMGSLLEKRAASDKRSTSSYLSVLVERDLRAAGLMPLDDIRAQLVAAAESLGLPDSLHVLKREFRRRARSPRKALAATPA